MAESKRAKLRRGLNALLHPFGLHLVRHHAAFEIDQLLANAVRRGVVVNTWIDVGASDGQWSLRTKRHFPRATYLLFEPLAERQAALQQLAAEHGFLPVPLAAGAAKGSLNFVVAPGLDGSGVAAGPRDAATREVPVETVDRVVADRRVTGPYGLKLDTHGHEIPVLEGASAVLREASLVIIEAYNFPLNSSSLRFHELCTWMESHGFRCCDLADPMRRPRDRLLWQMDLAFAPATSPCFQEAGYH